MPLVSFAARDANGAPANLLAWLDGSNRNIPAHVIVDPTDPTRLQAVTAAGAAKVDGSAVTQPTQDAADGPVSPGAAASKSLLVGGQYKSTLPTLTDGQQAAAQLDSSGRMLVAQSVAGALHVTVDGTTSDLADGPVSPGTAATKSMLAGGQYKSTLPTLTDGQQGAVQTDANGRMLVVQPVSGALHVTVDNTVTTTPSANTESASLHVLSAAGVGTTTGGDQTNAAGCGVKVFINISAISGTGANVVVKIQGKDPATSTYVDLLASAALSATGMTTLTLYPGIAATANVAASDILPKTWRVIATVAGTTPSVTATVGGSIIA